MPREKGQSDFGYTRALRFALLYDDVVQMFMW